MRDNYTEHMKKSSESIARHTGFFQCADETDCSESPSPDQYSTEKI